jgi:hypothetical protein
MPKHQALQYIIKKKNESSKRIAASIEYSKAFGGVEANVHQFLNSELYYVLCLITLPQDY